MKKLFFLLVAMGCLIISCTRVSFLYPLSEKKENKIFRKELLGKWKEKQDEGMQEYWIDSTYNQDSLLVYSINITDTSEHEFEDSSFLTGELVNLQGKLFLTVSSNFNHKKLRQMGVFNAAMVLPAFYIVRIYKMTPDSLQIGQIDGDYLIDLLKEKKVYLKHELIEKDDLLILEKPQNLQLKLLELEKFPKVYKRSTLYR